ncbi:uncharacterized protein LOC131534412 [Onychostoma macrolepis]|uniref:uncharacterized protein LOC131534412 n=1 Tax=Onychostoma macrolepis TaxID=369639 RepID=UPI00272B008B|nr:uncharacterized protein LOC131534412 [Onychostoma macrolepis]
MEELLRQLTDVSLRQQQIVEHLATRQGQADQEIAALRTAARQRVPLPDPRVQAAQLLPKMTAHDDVESYIQMFETTAITERWDPDDWARALAPLLTGEAQRAFFSLPAETAENYEEVKKEILAHVGLSPTCAAQAFFEWTYQPRRPARVQVAELSRLAQHWLMVGTPTAAQVTDRVVVDRLLRALPRSVRPAVGMRSPTTTSELVEAIELAEAAHRREAGERVPPFPRRVVSEQRTPEGISRPVDRTAAPEPQDEPMPTASSSPKTRTWWAGCVVHQELPKGAPTATVRIGNRHYRAVLDSGSAVSLVQTGILPPPHKTKATVPITCVHGDTREVPVRRLTIAATPGSWPVDVGLVKDLPVAVLLGRDWPGFEALLRATTQPACPNGGRRRRRAAKKPSGRPVLLASDSGRDGESPSPNTNLF